MSVSTLGSVSECTGLGHTSALFAQINITQRHGGREGLAAQLLKQLEQPRICPSQRSPTGPSTHPAQPHTNSVKSSTEETRRFRWPVS